MGGGVDGVADGSGLVGEDLEPRKGAVGELGAAEVFGSVKDIACLLNGVSLFFQPAEQSPVGAGILDDPVDDPRAFGNHRVAQIEAVSEQVALGIVGAPFQPHAADGADHRLGLHLVRRIGLLHGGDRHPLQLVIIGDDPPDDGAEILRNDLVDHRLERAGGQLRQPLRLQHERAAAAAKLRQ